MSTTTQEHFVHSLTPSQLQFFYDYVAQREAGLQQTLAELSIAFGRISREQQQLTDNCNVLARR
ncbi:MAG TPA: hypothetical protein VGC19_00860 [Rhodanobacter sp.]